MSQIQLKEPSFDMCGSSKPYDDCNSWRWKGCIYIVEKHMLKVIDEIV